ncbi:MAG: TonB-dependent receptor, partial [Phenylobacterium sp.]|nr:TonB-dependent receptor [Phenylobacterium sp.]
SFDDIYGGGLKLGSQVTWNHKYTIAEVKLQGVTTPGFEGVGKFNYNTGFYPIPEWRGMFYAEWDSGPHNIRLQTNYIDSYVDQRTTPYIGNLVVGDVTNVAQATVVPRPQDGKKIDAFVTTDVTYRVFLPWDTTAVFNITNIFDTDPPLARLELNYDALTANALGRTYKIALTKKF